MHEIGDGIFRIYAYIFRLPLDVKFCIIKMPFKLQIQNGGFKKIGNITINISNAGGIYGGTCAVGDIT